MGNTSATATKNVSRANNDGQTNFFAHALCFFHVVRDTTAWHLEPNFQHCHLKFFAIFGSCNCLSVGANQFRFTRYSNYTLFKKSHCQIECSLSSKSWQHCIGFFTFDDRLKNFWRERLNIRAISKIWIGHDRGWIGIRQNDAISLFFQDTTCLRT